MARRACLVLALAVMLAACGKSNLEAVKEADIRASPLVTAHYELTHGPGEVIAQRASPSTTAKAGLYVATDQGQSMSSLDAAISYARERGAVIARAECSSLAVSVTGTVLVHSHWRGVSEWPATLTITAADVDAGPIGSVSPPWLEVQLEVERGKPSLARPPLVQPGKLEDLDCSAIVLSELTRVATANPA